MRFARPSIALQPLPLCVCSCVREDGGGKDFQPNSSVRFNNLTAQSGPNSVRMKPSVGREQLFKALLLFWRCQCSVLVNLRVFGFSPEDGDGSVAEWVMIELQGDLQTKSQVASLSGKFIGDLCYTKKVSTCVLVHAV